MASALHPKLGSFSPLSKLPVFVIQDICSLAGLLYSDVYLAVACKNGEILLFSPHNITQGPVCVAHMSCDQSLLERVTENVGWIHTVAAGSLLLTTPNNWLDWSLHRLYERPIQLEEASENFITDEFHRIIASETRFILMGAGSLLALCAAWSTVHIWDMATKSKIVNGGSWTVPSTNGTGIEQVQSILQMLQIDTKNPPQRLMILTSTCSIQVWDLDSGISQGMAFFSCNACCCGSNETGAILAAFTRDKTLCIFSLPHLQLLQQHFVPFPEVKQCFAHNNTLVSVHDVCNFYCIYLTRVKRQIKIWGISDPSSLQVRTLVIPSDDMGYILKVFLSPTGDTIVACLNSKLISVNISGLEFCETQSYPLPSAMSMAELTV